MSAQGRPRRVRFVFAWLVVGGEETKGCVRAAAIHWLLGDPQLRRRLGANLRQKVEREYSTEEVIRRWEALFEKVIAEAEILRGQDIHPPTPPAAVPPWPS